MGVSPLLITSNEKILTTDMEHHKKYNDVTSEGGAMRYVTAWAGSSKCWGSKSSVGNICQAKLLRFRSSVASIFDGQTCARTSEGLLLAGSIARANSDSEFRLIERQSRVEKMFTQRATTSVINTLLPYNNPVGEKEYMPCKQRENEDQVSRPLANTLKTTDLATGKDNSRASRPTSLGRGTTSSNGFSSRFPGSTQAGGSQASSPESSLDMDMDTDSFQESENNAAHAQLENDTRNLLTAFFHSYNGLKHSRCSQPKALATMDRVVKSLVIKHEIAYKGMINRLNLDERGDDMSFLSAVAKDTFSDGVTNWGRIASLLSFSAELCRHLKNNRKEHCIDQVASLISSYLLSDQLEWLINNKAWDGFVEFFHVADPESTVRGALMTLAGMAGLGAGLALLIR